VHGGAIDLVAFINLNLATGKLDLPMKGWR